MKIQLIEVLRDMEFSHREFQKHQINREWEAIYVNLGVLFMICCDEFNNGFESRNRASTRG